MTGLGKYIVRKSKKELEPQEVLLDSLAQKSKEKTDLKELKFEVPPSKSALNAFLIFSLFVILALFAKAFQLSVIRGKELSAAAEANFSRTTPLRADRGIIYDQSLQKLVSNLPSFDLILDKRDLPTDSNQFLKELKIVADIIGQDELNLAREIADSEEIKLIIAENLKHETIVFLKTEIDSLPSFQIEENIIRDYSAAAVFSQVLGYTGRINPEEYSQLKEKGYFISDYLGKQGLEKSYETILRGEPGIFELQKDATGKTIKQGIVKQPEPGQSLVLWLDADLQQELYSSLSRIIQSIGVRKAAAVAMDPKNGGVLAMVSLPSFDNNIFLQNLSQQSFARISNDPDKPLFNRAISGNYASGSSIKPLIAISALQEKIISPEKQIYDQGFIEVKSKYNPTVAYVFHDNAVHGWVDMRKAIAVSCNTYFYTIGGSYQDQAGLGSVKIKNYLELFGWGQKTGIDLPQETDGLIPNHQWKEETIGETWYSGDTYNLSIGQGYLQVSPLQIATAFAAIANNGKLFKPQVVKEIVSGSPDSFNVIKQFEPSLIRNLPVDLENIKVAREGMRQGVAYGSAALLNDLPVSAAAKTGTAQTSRSNFYVNWVTVFAPYDDPQIVLTVMIEDVPGVRAAALPVANEVLNWYFSR